MIDHSDNKRRRLTYLDDLVISTNEHIMVIDNGCDQTIININSFLIQSVTGAYVNIGGGFIRYVIFKFRNSKRCVYYCSFR